MQKKSYRVATAVGALLVGGCLATAGVAAGAAESAQGSSDADEAQAENVATEEQAIEYCGMCHFKTAVESGSVESFNSSNVNRAMVESMVPMLDDDTIDALANYFAQIDPPAADEG